jgi:hypothetical protein
VITGARDRICGDLPGYRMLLERARSAATAHPAYAWRAADGPGPRGQCGVASAWVAHELRGVHGIEATYCCGALESDAAGVTGIDHHCWLEVGHPVDPGRLVIDMTSDQASGLGRTTLCASHEDLAQQGLRYVVKVRRHLDELGHDSVWPRFLLLREAVRALGEPPEVTRIRSS